MKTKRLWLSVVLLAGIVLASGASGALTAAPAPEAGTEPEGAANPEGVLAPEAEVAGVINYQGRLTDPGGVPLTGTYPMRFQIYNDASAGTLQWDSGTTLLSVVVDRGLFNVGLSVDPAKFNGQGLWLRIYVNGEWLTPRQALQPVPYALSLKPGAVVRGEPGDPGHVVRVEMSGSYPTRTAVWGFTVNGTAVRGTSATGYGLEGRSDDGIGVYGYSTNAYGVYGATGGSTLNDSGVYGRGGDGTYAVYGYKAGTGSGLGVYGYNAGSGSGTSGYSALYVGVHGATGRADNNYGFYTPDNIHYASATALAAEMQVVQNLDELPLEAGDVVEIAGMGAPLAEGLPPVIQVRRVRSAESRAVLGVVVSGYAAEALADPAGSGGAIPAAATTGIAPGDTLLVAVRGPARVKVEGSAPIQPGDLLSSGAQAGRAHRAPEASAAGGAAGPGSFLGKALEVWDGGEGQIYVYITLQ